MSILGTLFGAEELQQTGDQLDAQIVEKNREDYAPGGRLYEKIKRQRGQAAADAAYANVTGNLVSGATGNVDDQINTAFKEGLQDGANNITGFVSNVFGFVGKALGAILLGIPVWVWAVAAVGLWGWLGFPGIKAIRKKLA